MAFSISGNNPSLASKFSALFGRSHSGGGSGTEGIGDSSSGRWDSLCAKLFPGRPNNSKFSLTAQGSPVSASSSLSHSSSSGPQAGSQLGSSSPILLRYNAAKIIIPPSELDPVFVSRNQSDESLENLALSRARVPSEYNKDRQLQLFGVFSEAYANGCEGFCELGYGRKVDPEEVNPEEVDEEVDQEKISALISFREKAFGESSLYPSSQLCGAKVETGKKGGPTVSMAMISSRWIPDASWLKLPDNRDFSCREDFEKVFVYEAHFARQWGDGTVLGQHGHTKWGASPVFRFTHPEHPYVIASYGKVMTVWIRHSVQPIPLPYVRFQSTYWGGPSFDSTECLTWDQACGMIDDPSSDWQRHAVELQTRAKGLREIQGCLCDYVGEVCAEIIHSYSDLD